MRFETVIDQLRAVDLFRHLDDATLRLVAAAVQVHRYEPGRVLFQRGDEADAMFLVAEGKVRLSVISLDGRDLTLRYAGAGELFGEIALLDGGARTADAAVAQPTLLLTISRSRLDDIICQDAKVSRAFIKALCGRLRETTDQLESIALLPLEQRLARLLLNLAEATGVSARFADLAMDISQGDIAMMVNASRPKVNQILVGWHGTGIAVRAPKGLRLDLNRLRNIIDREND